MTYQPVWEPKDENGADLGTSTPRDSGESEQVREEESERVERVAAGKDEMSAGDQEALGGAVDAPARPDEGESTRSSVVSFLKELPVLVLTAVVIAYVIKLFILQPFYIPSSSMEPTLHPGDRVLVGKFFYKIADPHPGDVIVFIAPNDNSRDFIKRIVAVEGETVQIKNGDVYVDGARRLEPFAIGAGDGVQFGPVTVPENSVFVMGDNRPNSFDSRLFGPLGENRIVGKAFVRYWPIERLGLMN